MNRQQAEHLLDAYLNLENVDGDNNARQSLREVILDAMTTYKAVTYPNISYMPKDTQPYITKPIVTC